MYISFNDTAELNSAHKTKTALSLHIHVKSLLLIHEFYEITRETLCHALSLDSRLTPVFQKIEKKPLSVESRTRDFSITGVAR